MKRTLIKDLNEHIGKEVTISGWVNIRRDQGKMVFFDMRDMSGSVQCVALPSRVQVIEVAKEFRSEWVLKIQGLVNKRPEKNISEGIQNGNIEIEAVNIEVLAKSEPLPFDISLNGYNLDITTELDNRALVLRQPKIQAIFKVQETIIDSFREFMKQNSFFEFQAPAITPATAEGGRKFFKLTILAKKLF